MEFLKTKNIRFKHFKLLILTLFALYINNLYSQVSVQGTIKNINGNPVKFATIQLLIDSAYHQSTLSDSLGNYQLKATQVGNCELMTNCLGYAPKRKKINLNRDTTINFTLQTDTIWMNEVTITAKNPLIQAKSDRLVINIGGNIETEGKETIDILKQLPTLNVSGQSVKMSGKSSVLVYINDRVVRLGGQSLLSYLNSLPPDIIKSIEIISTPPSQYDAEGNVGVVKIVTKKNINPGWKEYIRAGFIRNNYSSYMVSAFVNYTGKKTFFEGNINNGNYTYLDQSEYHVYFPNQTISTFNPKKWSYPSSDAHATFGYNFNENSNIIFDFQAPLYNKETIRDIENQTNFVNLATGNNDSIIYTKGETIKNSYTYNSEAFFKHMFSNNKSYFSANTAYLNNYTLNKRSFSSETQSGNSNQTTEDYYTEGGQKYDILTSMLDFSFPAFNFTVNTGLKLSFINTASNSKFYSIFNDINILDTSLSNKYEYTEQVQALYYSMEKSIPNWSFKTGVRSEITQTTGKSFSRNETHKNSYTKFFPTVFVSHTFGNKHSLSLSYTTRIERPPYALLDPFKWYISKYDYTIGNPFLQPAYSRNTELTYILNNTFSTKLYYTDQNNKIGRYVILDSLNTRNQIQKADNFLNENSYGMNIYKLLKIAHWIETVLQNDFYYSEFMSNREAFSNIYGFGNIFTVYNTLSINRNLKGVVNLEEHIPGLYNYRVKKNYFKFDAGFNYSLSNKGISARLLVTDIFKTANPEYHYTSGGIKQVYKNYFDSRMIRLVVSWKLGNWYNKNSRISLPSNIDEKKRL